MYTLQLYKTRFSWDSRKDSFVYLTVVTCINIDSAVKLTMRWRIMSLLTDLIHHVMNFGPRFRSIFLQHHVACKHGMLDRQDSSRLGHSVILRHKWWTIYSINITIDDKGSEWVDGLTVLLILKKSACFVWRKQEHFISQPSDTFIMDSRFHYSLLQYTSYKLQSVAMNLRLSSQLHLRHS